MRAIAFAASSFLAIGVLAALEGTAFADTVVVLPFGGGANDGPTARRATESASALLGHELPSPARVTSAERAVADGNPDTSDEYLAAGRAASADWTVSGKVSRTPQGERIEVEVFQVASGRLESLSRLVTDSERVSQMKEMLALLLRREGVGDADPAWLHEIPVPSAPPPPASPPARAEAREAPPPRESYGENHPVVVSVLSGVNTAASRPSGATGSAVAVPVGVALGYALPPVPGLELRAQGVGHASGPGALMIDGGARYLLPLTRAPLFVGAEAGLGGFLATGAAKDARFLIRGSGVVAVALGERVQIEGAFDVAGALGGAGSLLLVGGHVGAGVRF